jgi:hypothetical protein
VEYGVKISFDASVTKVDNSGKEHPKAVNGKSLPLVIFGVVGVALFLAGRWTAPKPQAVPVRTAIDTTAAPDGFVKTDDATKGAWRGIYGKDGVAIATESPVTPAYVQVIWPRDTAVWNRAAPYEPRALQKPTDAVNRLAAAWYSFSAFDVDIKFTDGQTHQVAAYVLDWDSNLRQETIRVTDVPSSKVLDDRSVTGFNGGRYLVWNLTGHVNIKVTRVAGANAVMSALFFN